MSDVSVNGEALSAAQHELNQAQLRITAHLENLQSNVEKLRESWSGAAQDAYHHAQTEWTRSLDQMRQLLDEHRATLADIHSRYQAASANVSAIWK